MSRTTRTRRWTPVIIAGALVSAAASTGAADPVAIAQAPQAPQVSRADRAPSRVASVTPERADRHARSCTEPACREVRAEHAPDGTADGGSGSTTADGFATTPPDLRIHLGEIAVASMEGVWLRRGPTLRNEPIMVSPVVVAGALTLSLGGRF